MFTEHRAMVNFLHFEIFIVFNSFPFILGDTKQNSPPAVDIDHNFTDGEKFVKKIIHGYRVSERPGYLLFTAPYRLCEGGCKRNSTNFVMAFPLYIGKKGRQSYKSLYHRDFERIHSMRPNAPFKRNMTRQPFTTCPSQKPNVPAVKSSAIAVSETTTPLARTEKEENSTTNTRCPEVIPRNCTKKTTLSAIILPLKKVEVYNFSLEVGSPVKDSIYFN